MLAGYILAAAGCGSDYNDSASPPYRAQVISFDGLNDQGSAKFVLGTKTFETLTDLNKLDGKYLRIKRGGELKIREIKGSLVAAKSFSGGGSPNLRYQVKGGVVVPRDYPTLAQLSAYYQFDQVFGRFDEVLGFAFSDFYKATNKKITAYFEPAITMDADDTSLSAVVKLNAAYVPGQRQFVLFQRSSAEDVPLAANLQVVAHEFGHALFDYAFFKSDPDEDGRFEQEYALSGLNEGFADFISYRYTGSSDILRGSIDIKDLADQRNFLTTKFTYSDLIPPINEDICSGSFYCIGSLFARSLVKGMNELDGVTETEFSLAVIEALKRTQATMKKLDGILPKDRVEEFEDLKKQNLQSYTYNGEVLGAFFNAFLQHVPESFADALCPHFIKNFEADGFPTSAREGVCSK